MKARTILFAALLVVLNAYQYLGARPALSDDEVVERFHRIFVESKTLFSNKWFGVQTLQHPGDAWIMQEIIFEVKPDVIVETGTFRGGGAALWATILEHVNPERRVITIDISDDRAPAARRLPIVQQRVDFLEGSSTDPKIVSEVARRVKGKKVLVVLDSLHTKGRVFEELKAYSRLVSVGSYLVVQDTHLGESVPFWYMKEKHRWAAGPMKAVEEFIGSTDLFVIDSSRERFLATNNRRGFLKRVR